MIKKLLFLTFILSFTYGFSQSVNPWVKSSKSDKNNVLQNRNQIANNFQVFNLDATVLNKALTNSPKRGGYLQKSSTIIEFPNSKGEFQRFSIFEASVMHPDLQAKYPNIKSYAGKGIDDPTATIRFSISQLGLKSMTIAAGQNAVFMEPYTSDNTKYMVYDKKSKDASLNSFECLVKDDVSSKIKSNTAARPNADDGTLRTFRLAMSASGDYTAYFGGTKANALAAINATMTRVNGIFEIDFGVTMELIANTDAVIYTSANSDPYTTSLNSQLQSTLTSVIGESNYDVGHLVHKGSNNGNAGCIGCVCVDNQKGSGFTSHGTPEGDNFDVDYVAHELGHQFGGNHTWTFNGNEGTDAQVEPGSGSTIMGYAGITGATDVQAHSDPYFHAMTIQQITNYVKTTSCQTNTATGNSVPTALAGANYTIPKSTPFLLTGDGTDADGNNLSYCWEQMDENNAATKYPSTTATTGIAFRSFSPSASKTRSFPQLSTVLAGNTSTQWEAVPSVGRTLNFRLTVRDNVAGGGANNSDDMVVTVNSSAGPFIVSSPNTNVTWNAGQLQTVNWDVAGTSGSAVNCQTVNIKLSTDGGNTYPINLASGVANNGSAQITVPNNIGTQNRIRVEAADNIFYDVSNTNFTIAGEVVCNATVPTGVNSSNVSATGATIAWNSVSGATYNVQYREVGTTPWITVNTGGISTNLTGLNTLTQYEAQVQSVCSSGNSAFSALVNFTTLDQVLTYCSSKGNSVADEFISNVQIGTINNSSNGSNGYTDHTSISTNLNKGEAVTITITPTWNGTVYDEGYAVWIDYNKNGSFTDAGEQVWTKAASKTTPVSGTFTVPAGAVTGTTTMRVSMKYNGVPTACEAFSYGEVEDYTVVLMDSTPDTEAPTAATLTSSNITVTTVDLSWSGSTDNVGVTGYDVYKDNVLLTSVTGTTYQATGLTEATTYNFKIKAKDAAGNISTDSNIVSVTTLTAPDTQAPTAATLTHSNITETTIDLAWSGSTDNIGVTGYDVYKDNVLLTSVTGTSYQVTGLTNGTAYNFKVNAKDAAGNISTDSNIVSITTVTAPDTQAPTAPVLTSNNITETTVDLVWSGSTDNVGVTGYDVYKNNVLLTSITGTSYQATGLTSGSSYNFTVKAKDAAGNVSANSNTETITTITPDTQAPSAAVLSTSNITQSTVDLSWTASTDNVGVTGYDVYKNGVLLTSVTGTSYQATGLASNTSYNFLIKAKDAAGNTSDSNIATITTLVQSLTYCASKGNSVADEYISRVQIGTINNTSTGGNGYSDHTSISTNLDKGAQVTITITPTWTGTKYNEGYGVWIDYNQNGDFTDAGEQVWTKAASQTTPVSGTFTIPTSALDGATRMRVSMKYNGIPTACEAFSYGEVEDYTVVLNAAIPDTQAPTAPSLTIGSVTESTINLSWSGSIDNVGVTSYDVYQDGSLVTSTSGTTYQATGLSAGTTYIFTVRAKDAAGNISGDSNTASATTTTPDTQAPSAPSLSSANITDSSVDLSWNGATDNVGVTGYDVYQGGSLITTSTGTSYQVTGLTANTTYNFNVRAKDAAGNISGDSNTEAITTLQGNPNSTTILHQGFFESGWDGWSDGGSDVARDATSSYAYEGNYSIRLRDNSGTGSAMTLSGMDLSSYDEVKVEFHFYSRSMESGEDFWLRYHNGSTWSTVASYASGTDFENNGFYTATVTLDKANFNFSSNAQFRFQCDASGNSDYIYMDQITISGIVGTGRLTRGEDGVTLIRSMVSTERDIEEIDDFTIYPNPVKGQYINIRMANKENATYKIANILGQTVQAGNLKSEINVTNLKAGLYIIEVNDGDEILSKKFIKQ